MFTLSLSFLFFSFPFSLSPPLFRFVKIFLIWRLLFSTREKLQTHHLKMFMRWIKVLLMVWIKSLSYLPLSVSLPPSLLPSLPPSLPPSPPSLPLSPSLSPFLPSSPSGTVLLSLVMILMIKSLRIKYQHRNHQLVLSLFTQWVYKIQVHPLHYIHI